MPLRLALLDPQIAEAVGLAFFAVVLDGDDSAGVFAGLASVFFVPAADEG